MLAPPPGQVITRRSHVGLVGDHNVILPPLLFAGQWLRAEVHGIILHLGAPLTPGGVAVLSVAKAFLSSSLVAAGRGEVGLHEGRLSRKSASSAVQLEPKRGGIEHLAAVLGGEFPPRRTLLPAYRAFKARPNRQVVARKCESARQMGDHAVVPGDCLVGIRSDLRSEV